MKNILKTSGVYALINTTNNKWYIGSSKNVYRRKAKHFYELRKGSHYNNHLQRAFNLYGEEAFKFQILQRKISTEEIFQYERNFIVVFDTLNNGYNQSLPNIYGTPEPTEVSNEKKRRLGYIQHYGETSEEEYQSWLQDKLNPVKIDRTNHTNCKPVYSINESGNKTEYKSLAEAARKLDCYVETIRKAVNKTTPTGKPKKSKGLIWRRD